MDGVKFIWLKSDKTDGIFVHFKGAIRKIG